MTQWKLLAMASGLIAIGLLTAGCEREKAPPPAEEPGAEAPGSALEIPPATEDAPAESQPTAEDEGGTTAAGEGPAEGDGETAVESAPPAETPADEAGVAGSTARTADLGGVILNPKDDVKILLPDGWQQKDPDDGSLVKMVRRRSIGGVKVNVTLDYGVDENLPEGTSIDALRDEFTKNFAEVLAERNYQTVSVDPVTVAGHPALAIVGDMRDDEHTYRSKQLVILQGKTFWYLGVVGPRDEFNTEVEPEFNAIVQSLELP